MKPESQKQGWICKALVRKGTYSIYLQPQKGAGATPATFIHWGCVPGYTHPGEEQTWLGSVSQLVPTLHQPRDTPGPNSLGAGIQSEGPTGYYSLCKFARLSQSGAWNQRGLGAPWCQNILTHQSRQPNTANQKRSSMVQGRQPFSFLM